MSPREKNSERGWRRLEEEREETEDSGILELFRDEPDEDAPLSRADDDED